VIECLSFSRSSHLGQLRHGISLNTRSENWLAAARRMVCSFDIAAPIVFRVSAQSIFSSRYLFLVRQVKDTFQRASLFLLS
jgi:hypothetical protein